MKSCKSSETRFAKVSRRPEPCSRGKRPFKVSQKSFRGASRNQNVIDGYKIDAVICGEGVYSSSFCILFICDFAILSSAFT